MPRHNIPNISGLGTDTEAAMTCAALCLCKYLHWWASQSCKKMHVCLDYGRKPTEANESTLHRKEADQLRYWTVLIISNIKLLLLLWWEWNSFVLVTRKRIKRGSTYACRSISHYYECKKLDVLLVTWNEHQQYLESSALLWRHGAPPSSPWLLPSRALLLRPHTAGCMAKQEQTIHPRGEHLKNRSCYRDRFNKRKNKINNCSKWNVISID